MGRKSFFQIEKVLKNAFAVLLIMAAAMSFVACGDDVDDGKDNTTSNGVILPTVQNRTIKADGGNPSVTFETKAAFTIAVEDESEMIESWRLNEKLSSSGKAGKQSLVVTIGQNDGKEERTATVYIKVEGYERTKLVTFKQKTKSEGLDEVVKYMDERLKKEYFWLDEYNEKWNSFDFTVEKRDETGYNNMLFNVLGSMTSNFDVANHYVDGGADDAGRYIYTNLVVVPAAEHSSSTRAGGEAIYGYGFDISVQPVITEISGSTYFFAFLVEHVYANSPASGTGLRRSDLITRVDGENISGTVNSAGYITGGNIDEAFYKLVVQDASSISLEKEDFNSREKANITISRGKFNANPVAYSGVLGPMSDKAEEKAAWEALNTSGKKIGYMSYISFDGEGDDKMVDAVRELVSKGVEEMILDLRSNGGGSVVSAIKLSSMLVSESHVGEICCELRHNPKNINPQTGSANETYEFISENVKGAYNEGDNGDLPNLNMQKVYVIVSDGTASASEMVIQALRGIDVEVVLIGTTTEGKNCGMEVTEKKIGDNYYVFAPITFFNYNAKGDYRFYGGIKPERSGDMAAEAAALVEQYGDKASGSAYDWYPIPVAPWGNWKTDIALREAVAQINGTTTFGTWKPAETKPEEASVTRSGSQERSIKVMKAMPRPFAGVKKSGMFLMEGDSEILRPTQGE